MSQHRKSDRMALGLFLLVFAHLQSAAQTSAFTYQGKITDGGAVTSGQYDFIFRLFDSGGTQIGSDVARDDVQVTNGIFTVSLDFGSTHFASGAAETVEISVRPGASTGSYTTLSPRQPLTSSPYAVKSLNSTTADNAANAGSLGGIAANQYVLRGDSRLSDARNPLPNSANYIQNTTSPQTASSFNISGTGSATVFNAASQFNIAGNRILRSPGSNLFAGTGAGVGNESGMFFSTYFGHDAGKSSIIATDNSFFGHSAGFDSPASTGNSFFGANAGFSSPDGLDNSVFGRNAGPAIGGSEGVSLFGASSATASTGMINATAIGRRAFVSRNDSLVLGAINGVNGATANTNVGIGTTAPPYLLTIGAQQATVVPSARVGIFSPSGFNVVLRETTNAIEGALTINSSGVIYGSTTNHALLLRTNGTNRISIEADGNVGIGTTTPDDKLHVAGDIRVGTGTNGCVKDADGTVLTGTCSSDARLKNMITPFPATLEKLSLLRPVHFYWNAQQFPGRAFGTSQSFGLIAQEVHEVMPELVTADAEGYAAVRYNKLPLLLLQAVKELKAENDALRLQLERVLIKEEAKRQQARIEQQRQIDALKKLVCMQNPTTEICREDKMK